MAFDALTLLAAIEEMQVLRGAKIQKIFETPDEDDIIIHLYNEGKSYRLLISTNPQHSRMHITRRRFNHPPEPSNFCMLLRKHLSGGIISSIKQVGIDRIGKIIINIFDDLGRKREMVLMAETMGRFSNIMLLNEDNNILAARRLVSADRNPHRTVLPGHPYKLPPQHSSVKITDVDRPTIDSLIDDVSDSPPPTWLWLVRNIEGPGPQEARRILTRAGLEPKDPPPQQQEAIQCLLKELNRVSKIIENSGWMPYALNKQSDSSSIPEPITMGIIPDPIENDGSGYIRKFRSVCSLLDAHFTLVEEWNAFNTLKKNVTKSLEKAVESIERKLHNQKNDLRSTKNAEEMRKYGEIITTFMYKVPHGVSEVTLPDYYQNYEPISIPLDPKKSPADNASKYFDKYRKKQRAHKIAQKRIRQSKQELKYAQSLLDSAKRAVTTEELQEIRNEAIKAEYMKSAEKGSVAQKKKQKTKRQPYRKYKTPSGFIVYVGRHNRGNDYIISKLANSDDLWFHVKDIAGSHVLLRGPWSEEMPNDQVIEEVAILAAYHSAGRHSGNVPVDYTLVKYVNKPKGSQPGMVTYTEQQTVFVTPPRKLKNYTEL